MKKKLTAAILGLLLCGSVLSSCMTVVRTQVETSDKIEKLEKDNEKEISAEALPEVKCEKKADESIPEKEQDTQTAVTKEDIIAELGAVVDEAASPDEYALEFLDALVNKDKEKTALLTGGSADIYDFLDGVSISGYDITPIEITLDENNVYTNSDYEGYYLCTLTVEGENEYFKTGENSFYLETCAFSATGNTVACFMPVQQAKQAYLNTRRFNPDAYYYITSAVIESYGSILADGENPACNFNFNDRTGYHFVPHLMSTLEGNFDYEARSMTQMNEFIRHTFYENEGVILDDEQDYEMWISDGEILQNHSYEEAIYGCKGGHGGSYVSSLVTNVEETKGGVTVSVQTYGDFGYFAKARKIVFRFAPHIDGEYPILYTVDVVENTGIEECGCAF